MSIHLSPSARQEIARLSKKRDRSAPQLRLGVEPGGCSGWVYTLDFSPNISSTDLQVNCEGVQVALAPNQLPYLENLTLDYAEDLMGGSFRFHNPDLMGSCNCSNSFQSLKSNPNPVS